jgi:hypothetical protein
MSTSYAALARILIGCPRFAALDGDFALDKTPHHLISLKQLALLCLTLANVSTLSIPAAHFNCR